jgi:hypothetical protein
MAMKVNLSWSDSLPDNAQIGQIGYSPIGETNSIRLVNSKDKKNDGL